VESEADREAAAQDIVNRASGDEQNMGRSPTGSSTVEVKFWGNKVRQEDGKIIWDRPPRNAKEQGVDDMSGVIWQSLPGSWNLLLKMSVFLT